MTLTRGLGQSALSVVSLAMPGKWFRDRLTRAMGVYGLLMSVGFMLAFPAVGALVVARGWRSAWMVVGAALMLGLAPLAWLLVRRDPEAKEVLPDHHHDRATAVTGDATLGTALVSPAFWVFGVASSMYGLAASGIGLFNESILAELGFAPELYHQALAVTAISGLLGSIAAGAWADRGSLRRVLVVALLVLTFALGLLPHLQSAAQVLAQAVAMGLSGGFVMVVFFSFFARTYGRAHLGRIQGAVQAMTVVASALGPVALAWCAKITGSYAAAFYALAVTLALLALAAQVVSIPTADARE
jgi:MFS family permease